LCGRRQVRPQLMRKSLGSRTNLMEGQGAMVRPNTSEALPSSVKLAAGLFVAYGVAVVLNATALQGASGWVGAGTFRGHSSVYSEQG
jgi:hypothetical protein